LGGGTFRKKKVKRWRLRTLFPLLWRAESISWKEILPKNKLYLRLETAEKHGKQLRLGTWIAESGASTGHKEQHASARKDRRIM